MITAHLKWPVPVHTAPHVHDQPPHCYYIVDRWPHQSHSKLVLNAKCWLKIFPAAHCLVRWRKPKPNTHFVVSIRFLVSLLLLFLWIDIWSIELHLRWQPCMLSVSSINNNNLERVFCSIRNWNSVVFSRAAPHSCGSFLCEWLAATFEFNLILFANWRLKKKILIISIWRSLQCTSTQLRNEVFSYCQTAWHVRFVLSFLFAKNRRTNKME